MQIRQRIFKCFTMQICRLFFTVFWNFWRITRFSTTNHHWVISAQTGPVFWPTLYIHICKSEIHMRICQGFHKIRFHGATFTNTATDWKIVMQ